MFKSFNIIVSIKKISFFFQNLNSTTKSSILRLSIVLFLMISITLAFYGWQKGRQNVAEKLKQEEEELNADESFTKSLFLIELEKEKNSQEEHTLIDESFIDDNIDLSEGIFEEKQKLSKIPEIDEVKNQDFILEQELYQANEESESNNSFFVPTEESNVSDNFPKNSQKQNKLKPKNNLKSQGEIFRPE